MADTFVRRIHNIMTGVGSGAQPSYNVWPAPTGAPAAGVAVTSGAGAWGNVADIVAAAAIATEFWVVGVIATTLGGGAVQIFELQLSKTGPAAGAAGPVTAPFIYTCRIDPTAVTINLNPFMLPVPLYCAGGARVAACAGGAAARSLAVSIIYVTAW